MTPPFLLLLIDNLTSHELRVRLPQAQSALRPRCELGLLIGREPKCHLNLFYIDNEVGVDTVNTTLEAIQNARQVQAIQARLYEFGPIEGVVSRCVSFANLSKA